MSVSHKTIESTKSLARISEASVTEQLLTYHTLEVRKKKFEKPKMLIVTSIQTGLKLKYPKSFAIMLRFNSAKISGNELAIETALKLTGIKEIALVNCICKETQADEVELTSNLKAEKKAADNKFEGVNISAFLFNADSGELKMLS